MEYKMKKPAKKMMYGGKMPYADKMAGGGKTGMRGQVKKDDMNKKAVNSAVKEAMDSKYARAKLTHQKSLIWVLQGVLKSINLVMALTTQKQNLH
jgi:hypothetical protein